jgi:hypothetical protein
MEKVQNLKNSSPEQFIQSEVSTRSVGMLPCDIVLMSSSCSGHEVRPQDCNRLVVCLMIVHRPCLHLPTGW